MLHTLTVFTLMILISFALAATLLYMGYRRHTELRLWALALLLNGLTYVLFANRELLPGGLGILLPNLTITIGFAVFTEGVYYFQKRVPRRWLVWLAVPMAGLIAGFNLHNDALRLLLMGILNTCQVISIWAAMVQRRHSTAGRGKDLISIGLVGVVVVYGLRASMAFWAPSYALLAGFDHAAQSVSFTIAILSLVCIAQGMVVMLEERTEQTLKNSAARLQERERHYRTLIEASNEGICVIHQDCVRYGNPRLYEITGYRAHDVLGKSFLTYIVAEDRQRAIEFHAKRLQGQAERDHIEVRLHTATGVRWFAVTGVRYEWQGEAATLNFLSDITARKRKEAKVMDYAYRDALTSLPNRRALLERLPKVIAQVQQVQGHAALIFIDLDNFKPLNDQHGHALGDVLLAEVTHRLNTSVAAHDMVARFGGDEFVALLTHLDPRPEIAQSQALACAERIRQRLAIPYELTLENGPEPQRMVHECTASLGVVVFNSAACDAATLLDTADKAMYEAKQQGRDRTVLAENLPCEEQ